MKVSTIIATVLAGASITMATPAYMSEKRQQSELCAGTNNNPQCCATDVLGVADLDCANSPTLPTSTEDFVNMCPAIGQQAKCCLLPILEQALICSDVIA